MARRKGASRVVCASAGNLGQALAYSGRRRGFEVTVVAARTPSSFKLRQIAAFGADVRLEGEDIEHGGAMASGVGYILRSLAEHAEVIGIQPVGAPAMALSWRQGTVVETDRVDTIADCVAGRCPIPEVCGSNVDPTDFARWVLEPASREAR